MPPLLKTELLSVHFGGLTALSEVNLEAARGEIRAIIGPNGAGKSTFFNCLTGVLRPTGGRIIFDGNEITGLPSNAISQKGIARSYQITNILPNATVFENGESFPPDYGQFHIGCRSKVVEKDRDAVSGWQRETVGSRPAYVMPSTSGRNARTSLAELVDHLRAAAAVSTEH